MKLITWNTQSCKGLDGSVRPDRIVQVARNLADFDVLCLQEIAVDWPALTGGTAQDQPAHLAKLLAGYQLFFGAAVDQWTAQGQRRRFGNLIATRLPVLQVQHHALPFPLDAGSAVSTPRMCSVLTLRLPKLGAVRVMTTHLEFYSRRQRRAQARALRELHLQYCAQALAPPQPDDADALPAAELNGGEALLCGDFNFEPSDEEYLSITRPFGPCALADGWRLSHDGQPHEPTFCVHEQVYKPRAIACDFIFLSQGLAERVWQFRVDSDTRASDHQPVFIELR